MTTNNTKNLDQDKDDSNLKHWLLRDRKQFLARRTKKLGQRKNITQFGKV